MKADGQIGAQRAGSAARRLRQPHLSLLEREVRWEEEKRRELR